MKQNKLDHIAQQALTQFKGAFHSVEFLANHTSTIYKAIDTTGKQYALKIYDNVSSSIDDNRIEVILLKGIKESGTCRVAELIENKEGQGFSIHKDEVSDTVYRIGLFKWLEGVDFYSNESKDAFINLGKQIGNLHSVAKNIKLASDLQPKKWNKVFYFRDEAVVYKEAQQKGKVSAEFVDLMDAVIPELNSKLKKLYESKAPQLLHGDLNPWNIKINGNEIGVLDFEDVVLGQPIQDLAIFLHEYQNHEAFSYQFVKDYVLEGYHVTNPNAQIEEANLEFLMMARNVNLLNYVLTLDKEYPKFLARGLALLKAYLS